MSRESKIEEAGSRAFEWIKAPDGNIFLRLGSESRLVPRSYLFYDQVLRYCDRDEAAKAIAFANMQEAIGHVASTNQLYLRNGVWRCGLQGEVVGSLKRRLTSLRQQHVPAAIMTAAFHKHNAAVNNNDNTNDLLLDSPLASPDDAEIAYYGWMEYLRRYGSVTLDTVDDFESGIIQILVRSTSGRHVMTFSRNGGVMLSAQVPNQCVTCEQALDYLMNSSESVAKRIQSLMQSRRVTRKPINQRQIDV